jgi:hypothetical protein
MKYIEYLDLPEVPPQLIESIQDIINKPPKDASSVASSYAYFKTRYVNDDLKSWLQSIFDFEIYPQYQLVYKGLPIHVDKGNRLTAYNYLLDAGGENVHTAVYDENYKPLQIEKIDLRRWHRINTGMLHCVHGIHPDKVRLAISIGSASPGGNYIASRRIIE